jgi:hypothetical protein
VKFSRPGDFMGRTSRVILIRRRLRIAKMTNQMPEPPPHPIVPVAVPAVARVITAWG